MEVISLDICDSQARADGYAKKENLAEASGDPDIAAAVQLWASEACELECSFLLLVMVADRMVSAEYDASKPDLLAFHANGLEIYDGAGVWLRQVLQHLC